LEEERGGEGDLATSTLDKSIRAVVV
jgi:hypothetical protein